MKLTGFLVNVVPAVGFLYLGMKARAGRRWAYVVGLVLYLLDTLVLVWARDYIGMAVHAFLLLTIWAGQYALVKLRAESFQG